jgi:excisionase family DNA binding protein
MAEPADDHGRLTLNVPEAARLLGISRTTAYALAKSGRLPTIRLGKRILVPRQALGRLLEDTRGVKETQ